MAAKRIPKKIEEIHLAEIFLFWIERPAIFLFIFCGGIPRFLYYSMGVFIFSNAYYAALAYERLSITTPDPKEPSRTLFAFERYACWLVAMYYYMGTPLYRYAAAAVFVISNANLIMKFVKVNDWVAKDGNFLSIFSERWNRFKILDYCLLKKIGLDIQKVGGKEEEKEKPLSMEELAEEKIKLNEIERMPEIENVNSEIHREIMERTESAQEDKEEEGEDGELENDQLEDSKEKIPAESKNVNTETLMVDGANKALENEKKFKEECRNWEREKDNLSSHLVNLETKCRKLEEENRVLSSIVGGGISPSTEQEKLQRLVNETERIRRRLEAEIARAKAEAHFYRQCMHNLGLD